MVKSKILTAQVIKYHGAGSIELVSFMLRTLYPKVNSVR